MKCVKMAGFRSVGHIYQCLKPFWNIYAKNAMYDINQTFLYINMLAMLRIVNRSLDAPKIWYMLAYTYL